MAEQPEVKLETPRIEKLSERHFAGKSRTLTHGTMSEIAELWHEIGPHLGSIPAGIGRGAYGMGFDVATSGNGFDYFAGVQVSDVALVPDTYRTVTVPAREYVVFPHLGHVSQIGATCMAIGAQWFPESGYRLRHDDGQPDLIERYGPGFDPVTGFGDTEIWMPVTAKE